MKRQFDSCVIYLKLSANEFLVAFEKIISSVQISKTD